VDVRIDPATDAALMAACHKWRIHPLTAMLLWRWGQTPEGQAFAGLTPNLV
jgi:hypothetical protein